MPPPRPFRFDTLLRIRQRQEDQKSMALAEARRALQAARVRQAGIVEHQRAMLAQAAALAQARFDASEVRRYYQHERHLAQLAVEQDATVRQLEHAAETRRGELEEALKRRRVVERLRERRLAARRDALHRAEQQVLDEIAVNLSALRDPGSSQGTGGDTP
jgi:flagellar FliJ protein